MNRFILVLLLILGCVQPVLADPVLTKQRATQLLSQYRHSGKKIVYFEDPVKYLAHINELAYCYEGMQLCQSRTDFMKDHELIIGRQKIVRMGNTVKVRDEVIGPVFSVRNDRHVLRAAMIDYSRPVLKGGKYLALDGKQHNIVLPKKRAK